MLQPGLYSLCSLASAAWPLRPGAPRSAPRLAYSRALSEADSLQDWLQGHLLWGALLQNRDFAQEPAAGLRHQSGSSLHLGPKKTPGVKCPGFWSGRLSCAFIINLREAISFDGQVSSFIVFAIMQPYCPNVLFSLIGFMGVEFYTDFCYRFVISHEDICNIVLFQSSNIFYIIKKAFGHGSSVHISFDYCTVPVKSPNYTH